VHNNCWKRSIKFRGVRVFQRNDLIDPHLVYKDSLTNVQRMQWGRAPIGLDGYPIELHHLIQSPDGSIAEVTRTFHQRYSRTLHINGNTIPSGIDRAAFAKWREAYWKHRAEGFLP